MTSHPQKHGHNAKVTWDRRMDRRTDEPTDGVVEQLPRALKKKTTHMQKHSGAIIVNATARNISKAC